MLLGNGTADCQTPYNGGVKVVIWVASGGAVLLGNATANC